MTGAAGGPTASALAPSRGALLLGRVAIVLFPLLVLGALELGARLLGLEERLSGELAIPQWIDPDQLARKTALGRMADRPDDLRTFYKAYEPDRFLFYRLRPELHIPMVDILVDAWRDRLAWTLDTNVAGFRGGAATRERKPGVLRVACLGDSSTYGWGLDHAESYPARLQALLDERLGAGRAEVLNFGVPGYTSFQGAKLLEREVLAYRPDVVTIAYGANDDASVARTARERYEHAASWVGGAQFLLKRSKAYGSLKALLLRARGGVAERLADASAGVKEGKLDVSAEEYVALLDGMADAVARVGGRTVLVAQCLSRRPESRFHRLKEVAARRELPLVDVAALYDAHAGEVATDPYLSSQAARYAGIYGEAALADSKRLRYLLPDMCHPNALLAELIARELAATIDRGGMLAPAS